jgi:hypothetical protein
MEYEAIVEVLGFANGHNRAVRLVMDDGTEVVGVPSSVDVDVEAHEVFLKPAGDDETEIAISLGAISSVELA